MNEKFLQKRLSYVGYFTLALLIVIVLRLTFIQLYQNADYQTMAKENRIRLVSIKAARGEILMSDGKPMAGNELVYIVNLVYPDIPKERREEVKERLVSMLSPYDPELTMDKLNEKIDAQSQKLYDPIMVSRNVPWEAIVKLEENRPDLPGLYISIEPFRTYYNGTMAGHVIGYINAISQEELEANRSVYNLDSLVGITGIEKSYESDLRGEDGARRIEVNRAQRPVGELTTKDPVPGKNVYLTLNTELQAVLERSMRNVLQELQYSYPKAKVASAVVINVKTGEILAMASFPELNPDDFKGHLSKDKALYYFPQGEDYDPMNPGAATNRAIQVRYPPGSVFKPIVGMAALEYGGVSDIDDYVYCTGSEVDKSHIPCPGVHGSVNYYGAMAKSCNAYFQEVARRATKNNLALVAEQFGLGAYTGIDLPYENKGLLPTAEWKKANFSDYVNNVYDQKRAKLEEKYAALLAEADSEEEKQTLLNKQAQEKRQLEADYQRDYSFNTEWQQYDTFNMSIGQGFNAYTVLQLANYTAAVANGGYLYKPQIVSKIETADGEIVKDVEPELIRKVAVSPEVLRETKDAMFDVTQPGGTAYNVFAGLPVQVCAKTGTAEPGRTGDIANEEFHGVFIAFAPYDDPQIAFASIVEYGQHGSTSAAVMCRSVFEQYFGIVNHYGNAAEAVNEGKTDEQIAAEQNRVHYAITENAEE